MAKVFPFLKDFRIKQGALGGLELLSIDDWNEIPNVPGVYIIEATDGFTFPYPRWKSKVLYIGKSETSLRERLKRHNAQLVELNESNGNCEIHGKVKWFYHRYHYMHKHGARIYYYVCKGKQDAKNLESDIIWQFYIRHRALPVGNGAKSFSKQSE